MTPPAATEQAVAALRAASREVDHFERKAADSRVKMYRLMAEAVAGGVLTPVELASVLGLSRQRVHQLLAEQRKVSAT